MVTDSEQFAKELMPRNGRVSEPRDVRLSTIRSDSPVGIPQLDYVSSENPLPIEIDKPVQTVAAGHVFNRSERLTVGATVIELTKAVRDGQTVAVISVESATIRTRVTGEEPTATAGKIIEAGDIIRLENEREIADFRAIRRDGISATIDVEYGT